ncbi:myotubularin-related protein 13 isoform X3 [Neocloeon triangulifer]|uniref:myotubularin-related protein 13 isoform X3 n=1 Tax=Neocloeon triangulifer TaxID=2078957 RepID=UPI00286ED91C|nr:myotubularin-related protein 13 isoform X3 [Neocloeon triangulifer]
MSRLADYFVIVGYDHEKERSGISSGVILQRFPEKDWPDTPFIDGIEWFCQPQGWSLSSERQEPKFFVYVLTDIDCNRHYCACLCFNETVSITPSKPADEEEDNVELESNRRGGSLTRNIPAITHHSIMYAPKCLVLVSRLDYTETFRNCLGVIYTAFLNDPGSNDSSMPLETLVGNILGCVQVPPPGGPQVRFSIGAGDRQALQPPLSATLPVTGSSVSLLFHQFGIRNVLSLLCAIMTEHKILFHSKSYSRLTEGCRALIALMYPFKQSHVYIPLLPANLLEVLSTPTPFLMGIHSSLKGEIIDLADVIVADMDGGALTVPEGLHLPLLPEPLLTQTQDALMLVLQPELSISDLAFAPVAQRPHSSQTMLDKELRAVFMRTLANLLQGYRSCLTIIRIHPKPLITFNKAAFLSERGLTECDFTTRLLDCMFYTGFVQERGPPWRVCDLWDELYSNLGEQLRQEGQDPSLVLTHIQDLAKKLHVNENPNPQPYVQKIGRPPEGASSRIHQPKFPLLSSENVQKIIDDELTKFSLKSRLDSMRTSQPRIVPMGALVSNIQDSNRQIITNSARRLEVLKNCINCIFENKISDARKTFPAVLRALKAKQARLALCTELSQHVLGNKAMLEHQQFDLIVRLMNCALQDDSVMDGHGVAAALLPLATAFCRKLCTGVIQFAYTCIQDHKIWKNQLFWECSFYHDVQKDIKALYLSKPEAFSNSPIMRRSMEREPPLSPGKEYPWKDRRSPYVRQIEPSALEIAAEQMRVWGNFDPALLTEKQKEYISSEESTLYSQAIHYANRMVYLLVPLDIGAKSQHNHRDRHHGDDDDRASNSITNSMIESDSLDAESGFEEQDPSEIGNNVIKTVTRFVDKVSTEGNVSAEHIRSLHQMIPGVVHMHVETLEAVHRESKRLPPVQKPKIMEPTMLPGEMPIVENLRVFLLPDGREDPSGALGGPTLLPAEGALFLTNYRVVFRGTPCDPYVSEHVIVRAFPITTLTKEKRISGVHIQSSLDQMVQEGLQLRSCTFQLIKVAFDEEVTTEMIEAFRKSLHKAKNPMHPFQYFALNGHAIPETIVKDKEKNATLKGFAKKTLLKTARKAGLKSKSTSKKQRYVLPNMGGNNNKYLTSPSRMSLPPNGFDLSEYPEEDNESILEEMDLVLPSGSPALSDAKTLERLSERSYVRDWSRLGFCSDSSTSVLSNGTMNRQRTDPFRITTVNHAHMVCYSYPAMLVVPYNVSDDSIRRLTRCHRGSRIPVITWRHPRTKALLLRGSSFHGKGVIGMFKGHQATTVSTSESVASNIEQEKFLNSIVQATPSAFLKQGSSAWGMTESSLSIDSLLITVDPEHHSIHGTTPEQTRKTASNPFSKMVAGTLGRKSGGKTASMAFGRWGSLKDRRQSSQASLPTLTVPPKSSQRYSTDSDSGTECVHTLQRAALYIFGEKSQMKGVKTDSGQKIDFIPVEYFEVKNTKNAFKKLMRACVPSSVSSEPDQTFAKLIEGSEWLLQLQGVMQLAGAAVDLLDVQGSSVMICLEDGMDITAQISSVAQICLDPYYRTLGGFRVLIEKEWLAFGHKFAQRSTLTEDSAESGFAPIFLQFLDIVHQIQKQFPLAFEFNDFFLRFLAYHYVSCRFRTFLFDSERERVMNGIAALDDKRGSLSSHYKGVDTGSDDDSFYPGGRLAGQSPSTPNLGQSVFDYIEKQHARSPIFYNFLYMPDSDNSILRPQSHLSSLEVWEYYLGEELCHGASYDLEIVQQDAATAEGDKEIASISSDSGRSMINKNVGRLVTFGYDGVPQCIPDSFSYLLEETHRCEIDLERLPQKWRQIWDKLELPPTDSFNSRHQSFTQQLVRLHGRLTHKRSTIEILMRGKLVNAALDTASVTGSAASSTVGAVAAASGYSRPHRFDHYDFRTPSYCDQCSNILWGPVKTGVKCKDCGYSCHEKCVEGITKNCSKFRPVSTVENSHMPAGNKHVGEDTRSVNSNVTPSNQQYYDQYSSNVAENRTHEGYLYKRGALLKGWKMRWFVLDSIKHQLRYYDCMEDTACKGVIDLADVASVFQAPPAPVPPKKTDDKSFFDVKTSRRTYNFCASNEAAALEWIEKIQACLQ